jgi:hypothetical protein
MSRGGMRWGDAPARTGDHHTVLSLQGASSGAHAGMPAALPSSACGVLSWFVPPARAGEVAREAPADGIDPSRLTGHLSGAASAQTWLAGLTYDEPGGEDQRAWLFSVDEADKHFGHLPAELCDWLSHGG